MSPISTWRLSSLFSSLSIWMVSLDLQDTYFQVPAHPSSRRYLRFCVGESVFQFCALFFGLSMAPKAFTHIMALVSLIMHCHGFRILLYLDDWLVLGSSFRESMWARDFLLTTQDSDQHSQELTDSDSIDRLFRNEGTDCSFEGFPDPQTDTEAVLSDTGFSLQSPPSSVGLASTSGVDVLSVCTSSGCETAYAFPSASSECCGVSSLGRRSGLLGRLLPAGFLVVVRRLPSSLINRDCSSSLTPQTIVGCFSRRRPSVRLVVSGLLQFFHQPPGASCSSLRGQWFSSQSSGSAGCTIRRQHHGVGVPEEARGHLLPDTQFRGSSHPPVLRVPSYSFVSPVHSGQAECTGGFVELQVSSPRLRGVPPASSPLACHHRLIRDCSESPSPGVFFTYGRSTVSRHGCDAPVVGQSPGLCLSSLRPDLSSSC